MIARAFTRLDSSQANTLIVDLRGNPGGDISAMSVAAHLFDAPTSLGVLLGNGWYRDHAGPLSAEQMAVLPQLDRDDVLALVSTMRREGSVRLRVIPSAPSFRGRVYVLVDRSTASAAEPLAAVLRETQRAVVIGERTAGAMLSALPHHVGSGWVLILPEADYYTAGGHRLEGTGVAPDIISTSAAALDTALSISAKEHGRR